MEYLGFAILIIATLAVIALPIIKQDITGEEPEVIDLTLAKLEEEKENAYNALKEAEFDYKTGKLSDEDYKAVTDKYREKAMEAMHKLEEHEVQQPENKLDEENEATGQKATSAQKTAAKFCGSCGTAVPKDSKFCPDCGQRLN